jgi:hypothetical protein
VVVNAFYHRTELKEAKDLGGCLCGRYATMLDVYALPNG